LRAFSNSLSALFCHSDKRHKELGRLGRNTKRSHIDDQSPHIELHFKDDGGRYRAAINVKSTDKHDSRLVYWLNRNLKHFITDKFKDLGTGFRPLQDEDGLDYIRNSLVELADGIARPHDVPEPNKDIIDELAPILNDGVDRVATILPLWISVQ